MDAISAAHIIASRIAAVILPDEDPDVASRTARARGILEGLQQGTLDRSVFSVDANAYFSPQAIADFAAGLGPLGPLEDFFQTTRQLRGGMVLRVYRATFAQRALRVWTFELPDGKLEQFQVAPN